MLVDPVDRQQVDKAIMDDLLKRGAELGVAVMDEILAG
jgi:hypothetical protein